MERFRRQGRLRHRGSRRHRRATALAFAREGASVVVADLDEQANQEQLA